MEFKMGMFKSPKDERDFVYSTYANPTQELPKKFFLEKLPIKDQQDVGWCVGFAASTVKDKQERLNHPGMNIETSPSFVYGECKKRDGIPKEEGTYPRVAMQVLKDLGTCLEKTFPFQEAKKQGNNPQAPVAAYEEAKKYKVSAYAKVTTLEEMKRAIVNGSAILGGVIVTNSFMRPEAGGFIPMPQGYFLGGHAIAIDGYDDEMTHKYADGKIRKGFLRIVNSWNTVWGDQGYGWLPYDFFYFRSDLGMSFFDEAWTSVDVIMPNPAVNKLELQVGSRKAKVDGVEITLDQAPIVDKESWRTLLPLRQTCELFGQKVNWVQEDRRIEIGTDIVLWIDKKEALIKGKKVTLDQAPIVDSTSWRTLIPLRFVSEVLGYEVKWFEVDKKIEIIKK